ncbi:MAG: hypothetical protein VB934_10175 [Polyangiaceae bacterium]
MSSSPPEPAKKKTRRWPVVLFVFLLLALPAVGLGLYFGLLHHAPAAHEHVPDGTRIAMRADGAKFFAFKPVREHLLPLVLEARDAAKSKDGNKISRVKRIEQETGIHIPMDLREVIVASTDGQAWVVLIGGKIEPGRFVSGLQKIFKEEGLDGWELKEGMLVHTLGLTLAQADDGTLIFGTTPAIARAALPASDAPSRAPLPVDGALSFLIHEQAWSEMLRLIPPLVPGTDTLRNVEQASGHFVLSQQPRLIVRLDPKKTVAASKLATQTQNVLSNAQLALLLVPHDLGGAKDAIRSAKVEALPAGGANHVMVTAPWSYAVLDRAIRDAAHTIRGATNLFGRPNKQPTAPRLPF